ncbi:MAG: hypothetical protein CMN28_05520 [Salinisphaeraceae bacterium]|nr:hypothetical protein [Salinisphaeraceae bacterium]
MSRARKNVAAVTCTFRRNPVLRQCLDALAAQSRPPDVAYVVDNGGEWHEPSGEYPFAVVVIRPGENLGPGGGFALGFEKAILGGADYLWVMDDDIHPQPACLENLLAEAERQQTKSAFRIWPIVVDPDGSHNENPAWWGFLLPVPLVSVCGLPRADYAWWSEDTEYSFRLEQQHSVARIRVPAAIVHHRHASRGGRSAIWRLYYETRNGLHFRWRIKRVNYWKGLRVIAWTLKKAIQPPPEEGRRMIPARIAIVIKGIWHGISGRMGLRVKLG